MAETPVEGIKTWRNPRNGIYVAEVHYTADPAKRDPAWKTEAKRGIDERGWQREMEIRWDIPEGEPVFAEYEPAIHRVARPVLPEARLLRFWDFGHVCPVTLFAQLDLWGRLAVLAEVVTPHTNLHLQAEYVRAMSFALMGRATECYDTGDPAGDSFQDLGQVRSVLLGLKILLHTTPRTEGSYLALQKRLLARVKVPGEGITPAIFIHPRCTILHSALAGGFHINPKTGKPVDVHPDKDVCDALRYGNDNLLAATSDFMEKMRAVARADCAW